MFGLVFGEVLAHIWRTKHSSPQVGHWLTKDGGRRLIAWSNKPVLGDDGVPLYLVTAGAGRLRIGDEERDVAVGDCALIPPGAVHKIHNTGDEPLRIVCACAPAYDHADTVLVE